MADRFLVGRIKLPLDGCRVVNATFEVLNYNTITPSKFNEVGVTMSFNADMLPTNVSLKYSRMIFMHGA
jgi:hypothetical protein